MSLLGMAEIERACGGLTQRASLTTSSGVTFSLPVVKKDGDVWCGLLTTARMLSHDPEAHYTVEFEGRRYEGCTTSFVNPTTTKVNMPDQSMTAMPRRNQINRFTPAEMAIHLAMVAVEYAGGSLLLTEAVTLLAKAKDRVADHVDGVPHQERVPVAWLVTTETEKTFFHSEATARSVGKDLDALVTPLYAS